MPNPGLPRDDYQQRPPVRQAEMQPPPAMQQNNQLPGAAGGIPVFLTMPEQRTQANIQPPPVAPNYINPLLLASQRSRQVGTVLCTCVHFSMSHIVLAVRCAVQLRDAPIMPE